MKKDCGIKWNIYIYIYVHNVYIICDSLLGQSSSVAFMSNDSNPLSRRFMAQGPHAVTWLIPPNVPRHRKKDRSLPLGRRPRKLRSISSRVTYRHIEVVPIHRLSAVRSNWAYGGPVISSWTSLASRPSCPTTSHWS